MELGVRNTWPCGTNVRSPCTSLSSIGYWTVWRISNSIFYKDKLFTHASLKKYPTLSTEEADKDVPSSSRVYAFLNIRAQRWERFMSH